MVIILSMGQVIHDLKDGPTANNISRTREFQKKTKTEKGKAWFQKGLSSSPFLWLLKLHFHNLIYRILVNYKPCFPPPPPFRLLDSLCYILL